MVRRANLAPLNVHVSFEMARTSAQSLIDAYERLVPSRRRALTTAPEIDRLVDEMRAALHRGGEHG